jgi:beta-N-acetylhexosaminidase
MKPPSPGSSETSPNEIGTDQNQAELLSVGEEQKSSLLSETPQLLHATSNKTSLSRGKALLLVALLCIVLVSTFNAGAMAFIGPQGWASILDLSSTNGHDNLLKNVNQQLLQKPVRGKSTRPATPITPQQYIDTIVNHMTLDMKLGQMLIVQFVGPDYSLDLHSMISQYHVGAVLIFDANQNIISKTQLKALIQQMQKNSPLPLAIATDQEGGYVNRLLKLNGQRPSAASIGATNNPEQARAAGIQDAQDLSYYGINLNLAPVIDVDNNSNSELHQDQRTYGNNPTLVTQMAGAYLQGLQQSGKVIGTLKHFPGLGDVAVDPHLGVPQLTRPKDQLEQIDWAPYRTLIQQGNVHAIMVTHEIVTAIDKTQPSTLSSKVVTGILRNEFHYQGVIITDSLTMQSIIDYVPEDQAAALAIEAGSDLLMGASKPADVAAMINGIKQAIHAGTISERRIDESVRRILMMKYAMGLLPLPSNSLAS